MCTTLCCGTAIPCHLDSTRSRCRTGGPAGLCHSFFWIMSCTQGEQCVLPFGVVTPMLTGFRRDDGTVDPSTVPSSLSSAQSPGTPTHPVLPDNNYNKHSANTTQTVIVACVVPSCIALAAIAFVLYRRHCRARQQQLQWDTDPVLDGNARHVGPIVIRGLGPARNRTLGFRFPVISSASEPTPYFSSAYRSASPNTDIPITSIAGSQLAM